MYALIKTSVRTTNDMYVYGVMKIKVRLVTLAVCVLVLVLNSLM